MSITAAANVSATQIQARIEAGILSKIMKIVREHQAHTIGMIEITKQVAEQMQRQEPGKGDLVDVYA